MAIDDSTLTCPSLLQCKLRHGYFPQQIIIHHYNHCEAVGLPPTKEYLNTQEMHSEESMSMLSFTESVQQEHLFTKGL